MFICERKDCTGCRACANACPCGAINMLADEKGFYYPHIDEGLCSDCGACVEICPSNKSDTGDCEKHQPSVYAAWNKNARTRANSSSGGVFPLLAKEVLREKGVVFGARWAKDFSTAHCAATTEDELRPLSGSKYVQSNVGSSYTQVAELLQSGKRVLFSGTPCQIAGLNAYLGELKDSENLLTVDVVCHGVPSAQALQRYLREISKGKKAVSVNLRFKKPGWSYGSVIIDYEDGSTYLEPTVSDAYFCLFNFNYLLRDCCHICKYTTIYRQSDITLSDFWGFNPSSLRMRNFDKGVSCVIVNTRKGASAFDRIKTKLIYENTTTDRAKKANNSLSEPFKDPEDSEEFWVDYNKLVSFSELCDKYVPTKYPMPENYWLFIKSRQYMFLKRKLSSFFGR